MPSRKVTQARLEAGLCATCGVHEHRPDRITCATCGTAAKKRTAKRRKVAAKTLKCEACMRRKRVPGKGNRCRPCWRKYGSRTTEKAEPTRAGRTIPLLAARFTK